MTPVLPGRYRRAVVMFGLKCLKHLILRVFVTRYSSKGSVMWQGLTSKPMLLVGLGIIAHDCVLHSNR